MMRKILQAFFVLGVLAGCSYFTAGDTRAPHSLHDACSILNQRSHFLPAFKATERKYGVPVHVQMAVIYQESKFKSQARPPRTYFLWVIPTGRQSSAYGYAQALDGTWAEYKKSAGSWIARRDNIYHSADFMGWYMAESRRQLGISMDNAKHQYLAYHQGRTGYRRGNWRSKGWLVNVANSVDSRAATYQRQLRSCGKV